MTIVLHEACQRGFNWLQATSVRLKRIPRMFSCRKSSGTSDGTSQTRIDITRSAASQSPETATIIFWRQYMQIKDGSSTLFHHLFFTLPFRPPFSSRYPLRGPRRVDLPWWPIGRRWSPNPWCLPSTVHQWCYPPPRWHRRSLDQSTRSCFEPPGQSAGLPYEAQFSRYGYYMASSRKPTMKWFCHILGLTPNPRFCPSKWIYSTI